MNKQLRRRFTDDFKAQMGPAQRALFDESMAADIAAVEA